MKPYELSRNSWHFKIATKYGGFRCKTVWGEEYTHLDFCDYLQSVIWAVLKLALAVAILVFFGFCVYDLGLWVYESIQAGQFVTAEGRLAGMMLIVLFFLVSGALLIGVFGGLLLLVSKIQDYRESHSIGPSFLTLAVDKVRNKTCVQIKFKD